jgi:alcohol dehydrogenase YqhD (iron-dependent ADH family)
LTHYSVKEIQRCLHNFVEESKKFILKPLIENTRDYYRKMGRPQNIPNQQIDECESIEDDQIERSHKKYVEFKQ